MAEFQCFYKLGQRERKQRLAEKMYPFHNLLLEKEWICVIMWTNEIIVHNDA